MSRLGSRIQTYWPLAAVLAIVLVLGLVLPDAPNVRSAERLGASADSEQTTEDFRPQATLAPVEQGAAASTAAAPGAGQAVTQAADQIAPDCDPATGRIKIPSISAPYCRPAFSGDNGGSTYQGVTNDTITIVQYVAQEDPALSAILEGAGVQSDPPEAVAATINDFLDFFQHHYRTYGRKVRVVRVDGSGPAADDQAAKADAIKVAEQIKAFASIGAPNNTYVDELVARGVMCFCTTQLPEKFYRKWAPFVYGTGLPSYEQVGLQVAEYVGKRLHGRLARWAGDATFRNSPRRFGLVAFNTTSGDYTEGIRFLQSEVRKYGSRVDQTVEFTFDLSRAQEQSRTMIAKLKEQKITTVIMALDPIYPLFLTQEATRQRYFPEWLLTGSALTDTNTAGRAYDQTQWAHAFGLSALGVRTPAKEGDAYRLHRWHLGRDATATNSYGLLYLGLLLPMTGIHYAGPNLTPQTFRDGIFNLPPPKRRGLSSITISFGRHLWPFDDYNAIDDFGEIYWDPEAPGTTEVGKEGNGMYRFITGGKRYLPGDWPTTEPSAFNPQGTVTEYKTLPESDRPPSYEHKH